MSKYGFHRQTILYRRNPPWENVAPVIWCFGVENCLSVIQKSFHHRSWNIEVSQLVTDKSVNKQLIAD